MRLRCELITKGDYLFAMGSNDRELIGNRLERMFETLLHQAATTRLTAAFGAFRTVNLKRGVKDWIMGNSGTNKR